MNPQSLTIITVTLSAREALAFQRESFLHYNPDYASSPWLVFNNLPDEDGAGDYARSMGATVFEGPNSESCHGERISQLCEKVTTPYVLHLDNDVSFSGPIMPILCKPLGVTKRRQRPMPSSARTALLLREHGKSIQEIGDDLFHIRDNPAEREGAAFRLLSRARYYQRRDRLQGTQPSAERVYCSCLTRQWYSVNEWTPPSKHTTQYPYGTFDVYDKIWKGMWSPNIAVGLMRMDVIRAIHELGIGFGYYSCDRRAEWFETGGMLYLFARAMGYDVVELSDLWGVTHHWGSISTLWTEPDDKPHSVIRERYDNLRRALAEFREKVSCQE